MPGHRRRVAASHRAGQRLRADLQTVVERRGEQRPQDPFRPHVLAVDHLAQRCHGVTHKRDKMIRAMSQCSVIEGAVLLVDADRFGAHLQYQRLSDGQTHLVRCSDTEAAVADPVRVLFRPDERHGRMQRQRERSDVGERI